MIKIAWRNLWRHRGRTWITIIAIALTYSLYLMMSGIQEYTYLELEEGAAQAAGGAVLVQGQGFQDSQLNDVVLLRGGSVVDVVRDVPGVEHVSGRVILNGLLSTSASSSPARLQGVDPAVESEFQALSGYLREGSFLGTPEQSPLVVGSEIARELEVGLGDRVVFTATGPDGEMQRALFHVVGVLHTGSKLTDSGLAYTTVAAAQRALRLDDTLTQIGVLGAEAPEVLAARIREALRARDDLEVLTWAEAMPDIVGFIELDRAWGDVFGIVLFFVVLFAIMNTFLMAVMERVRELGLLRALGMTPVKVALLVLNETLFLTLVALAIGITVGLLGHLLVDQVGIDMTVFYGGDTLEMSGIALTDTVIYSEIDPRRWFSISLSVLFMVLFSAAYPAYKASRLAPAEAMRFYE